MFSKAISAAAALPLEWTTESPALRQGERLDTAQRLSSLPAVAPLASADPLSLAGLSACVEDARMAALSEVR